MIQRTSQCILNFSTAVQWEERTQAGHLLVTPSPWFALIYVTGRKSNMRDGLDTAEHCLISDMLSLQPKPNCSQSSPYRFQDTNDINTVHKTLQGLNSKGLSGQQGPFQSPCSLSRRLFPQVMLSKCSWSTFPKCLETKEVKPSQGKPEFFPDMNSKNSV